MPNTTIYADAEHHNVLIEDFGLGGLAVQANQHIIIHRDEAMLLDPGGHKIYSKVLSETANIIGPRSLRYIFLSHQDPDIVAAVNGWLMTTDAEALISELWVRFVPHFGLDHLVAHRLRAIPDEGLTILLAELPLRIIPAHFLHSAGNFQVYDARSRILYSGDLGASLGAEYVFVEDFEGHLPYMEGFHRRYMTSNAAMRAWASTVRSLDIEVIAPQHGALFRGKALVERFIDWCASLECGVDLLPGLRNEETPDAS